MGSDRGSKQSTKAGLGKEFGQIGYTMVEFL